MWDAVKESDAILGDRPLGAKGITLESVDVVRTLNEAKAGFRVDPGGRLGIWHPGIDALMGLYYNGKHICSMDRGTMPQWPQWETSEDLVEVPLDYALAHDDMPVLTFFGEYKGMQENDTAMVLRPQLRDVKAVGWAEVFFRLLKAQIPGIDLPFFVRSFRVNMDWYGQFQYSPIRESYLEAMRLGYAT